MKQKTIRIIVDETFYIKMRKWAKKEGFKRNQLGQFYRKALKHFVTHKETSEK